MKRGFISLILLVASVGALAQAPAGAAPPNPPKVSPAIPIAIQSLQQRSQQIQQMIDALKVDFTAIDSQIKTEAPGYHLSPATLQIERETVTTNPTPTLKPPPAAAK